LNKQEIESITGGQNANVVHGDMNQNNFYQLSIFKWLDFVTQPTPPKLNFLQFMFIMWFKFLFWFGFPLAIFLFFLFYIPGGESNISKAVVPALGYLFFTFVCVYYGSKIWEKIK